MEEVYALIGKLYIELYQCQKMIEIQNEKIKQLMDNKSINNEPK